MSPAILDTMPVAVQVDVLRAVARSKHPRLDMGTIAHNRGLSLEQVKVVCDRHGYPDQRRMLQRAEQLLNGDVAATAHQPTPATPEPTAAAAAPPTPAPAAGGGGAPYIAALPLSALFADETYQRPLDELRVQRMAAKYDVALVGIIEVSARPDGRYAILDGQHRWAVVRDVSFDEDDNPHLPCRVHTGLTVAEEAKLYHQLNTTRKQLTGWDRWWARHGAGDPAVLDIEKVAAANGYTIGPGAGDNILRSTRSCENVVALNGLPLLNAVLATTRAAYAGDQAGVDGAIIYGLGHILNVYANDELDMARLHEALTGIVPRQLTARAAAMREVHKGTMDRLVALVIVERYNSLRGPKLPSFTERMKPHTKTPTAKKGAEERQRQAILEWAERTGWSGRLNRCSKAMRDAYAAAHADREAS